MLVLLAAAEIGNEIFPVTQGDSIHPIQDKSVNREGERSRQPKDQQFHP